MNSCSVLNERYNSTGTGAFYLCNVLLFWKGRGSNVVRKSLIEYVVMLIHVSKC